MTIIVASWLIFVGSPSPILSQEAGRPLALVHARVIDVSGGGHSANRETGKHDYDEPHQKAYSKLYKERGAKYLAGSATDVWGTMPGISLHTELAKLPPRYLQYIVVHELVHHLTDGHDKRFYMLMDKHLPGWRKMQARIEEPLTQYS